MNTGLNSELQATRVPSVEELRARFLPPPGHSGDVIVLVNGHRVWKKRTDLGVGEPFIAFFGGDYSAVLEPDDPKIQTPGPADVEMPWPSM
ncbi:hypothetical protein GTP44_03845 [Duganella sp. FT50W]|uniref:Uncharacterized protein n=1 Tax=Duganella lactea TaxID=2692173 RepID=A0A6L8ME76_9BURK|nr:hypothetical protein [Duganella lactea]MYM81093.1 hypothetical protein [Duganella lactea]